MASSTTPEAPTNLKLNTREVGGQRVQVWTTRLAAHPNLIPDALVEGLRVDTRDRLMPLVRALTQGKQILAGRPYDSNDPDWLAQMELCNGLDEAISRLHVEGISTDIIDSLNEDDGVLSIGFMQLEPLGSGFREIYPESEVQFIHALS